MGSKFGLGLKTLQWFIRAVQFLSCAVVLGLFSSFLVTMRNHDIGIPNDIRAVEGISGAGVVYTGIALLFLWCLAGYAVTSTIAIILDVFFSGAFIYVGIVNRGGASSCNGYVNTPYGRGLSTDEVTAAPGFTNLPSFREACKMQTACLAISVIAILFFILSLCVEVSLIRNRRREQRLEYAMDDEYTCSNGRQGFFSRFRRGGAVSAPRAHPEKARHSYATESTSVGRDSVAYPSTVHAGHRQGSH